MSDWLVEELRGLYVVTVPGCALRSHPEVSPCDCAAFDTRVEADDYARMKGYTQRSSRRRSVRPTSAHQEWLAWKRENKDTHRCVECGMTSTLRGVRTHQGRSGHYGIGAIRPVAGEAS